MKGWRMVAAAAVLGASLVGASPARAGQWEDAGWGALAVLGNFVYMPAKLVYATFGGLTGGLALGLTGGDMDTADKIWVASMGGTYVLTPSMIQGQDPIAFAGAPSENATASANDSHGLEEQPIGG